MSAASRPDAILARLRSLYPTLIDLSLGRLEQLLERLGHPERDLPPVLHVAGTNGKGSTCALLRAIAEADGKRVHVMTSPHLMSITERFRLAGTLVTADALSDALERVERVNDGAPITVFEALTAAGFVLFASVPADLAIVEVGLGGRYDATNVVATTRAAAITAISLDHENFLGDRLELIAGEKAGIMRPGRPVITGHQVATVLPVLDAAARATGAPLFARDREWRIEPSGDGFTYEDGDGALALPRPALLGPHQLDNAGIAVATLRRAALVRDVGAYAAIARAVWPGRLQRLTGRLAARVEPAGHELWLDGGHNPGGAAALAAVLATWRDRPCHLVIGMKDTKDPAAFLAPLLPDAASLHVVAEPDQEGAIPIETLMRAAGGRARPGPDLTGALDHLGAERPPGRILICGSLHLAGAALRLEGAKPG